MVAAYGPAEEAESAAEMARIRKELVDLHGEMVLLENYSSINYTGLSSNPTHYLYINARI